MRLTYTDIEYLLAQDSDIRILFVEGLSDLGFWRGVIGELERGDCAIYCADAIDDAAGEDGCRGKLVRCAAFFRQRPVSERLLFFIDADCDYGLQQPPIYPSNVVSTDFRDMEAYGQDRVIIDRLTSISFHREQSEAASILASVEAVCRPLGILRVISTEEGYKLPFQDLLSKHWSRYVKWRGRTPALDRDRLLRALVQESTVEPSPREADVRESFRRAEERLNGVSTKYLAQGKDFCRLAADYLDVGHAEMERLLRTVLTFCSDTLRQHRSISYVEAWVRAAS